MKKRGKYVAVRPDSLIEARYDLTPKQNDILDIVLSRVENDDNYLYDLDIADYKLLYKTNSSNIYRDFKKAVKEFEGKGFYLIDTKNSKEIFFAWFASIAYLDKEGKIVVEIGQRLKSLLVEMKKRIFYKIEYPLNFSSVYSKRIYYYLKSFQDTGWRIDEINALRKKLYCPDSYDKYSFFKNKVLDQARREINSSSDIDFEYIPIKSGRKVSYIKFFIKNHTTLGEVAVTTIENTEGKDFRFNKIKPKIIEAITLDDSNPLLKVKQIIKEDIIELEARSILSAAKNDINKIQEKYKIISKMNKVNNVVGTMITALKEDWQFPKGKEKVSAFNDYEQRAYNIDELEKKLLGRK